MPEAAAATATSPADADTTAAELGLNAETAPVPVDPAQPDPDEQAFQDAVGRSEGGTTATDGGEPKGTVKRDQGVGETADGTESRQHTGEPAPVAEPEGFDEALHAYLRTGLFSHDEIQERYRKDPEAFVESGEKLHTQQREQDQFGSRFREWENNQGQVQDYEEPDGSAETSDSGEGSEDVAAILSEMGDNDLFGEMAEPMERLVKAIESKYETHIADLAYGLESMRHDANESRLDNIDRELAVARASLAETYEDLKKDGVNQEVLAKYDKLAKLEDESQSSNKSVSDIYGEAARWEFGNTPAGALDLDDLKSQMLRRNASRKAGTPRTHNAGTRERPPDADAEEYRVFNEARERALKAG